MLEIQSNTTALDVDKEDHVFPVERSFRVAQDACLLLIGKGTMVLEDSVVLDELIFEEAHLVLELTEDDPPTGLFLGEEILGRVELCARA